MPATVVPWPITRWGLRALAAAGCRGRPGQAGLRNRGRGRRRCRRPRSSAAAGAYDRPQRTHACVLWPDLVVRIASRASRAPVPPGPAVTSGSTGTRRVPPRSTWPGRRGRPGRPQICRGDRKVARDRRHGRIVGERLDVGTCERGGDARDRCELLMNGWAGGMVAVSRPPTSSETPAEVVPGWPCAIAWKLASGWDAACCRPTQARRWGAAGLRGPGRRRDRPVRRARNGAMSATATATIAARTTPGRLHGLPPGALTLPVRSVRGGFWAACLAAYLPFFLPPWWRGRSGSGRRRWSRGPAAASPLRGMRQAPPRRTYCKCGTAALLRSSRGVSHSVLRARTYPGRIRLPQPIADLQPTCTIRPGRACRARCACGGAFRPRARLPRMRLRGDRGDRRPPVGATAAHAWLALVLRLRRRCRCRAAVPAFTPPRPDLTARSSSAAPRPSSSRSRSWRSSAWSRMFQSG